MKKKILLLMSAITFCFLIVSTASAQFLIPMAEKAKEKSQADTAPVIVKAGDHLALNAPGLEKITYIHYKKGYAKPPWAGGGKKEEKNNCYGFLSKGAKWKNMPVGYVIDPDNNFGLEQNFIENAISDAAEEWDNYTSTELFGSYIVDNDASWDDVAPDGRNEFVFGDYPKTGVIAVTNVWGYFSGPPGIREIVEFDVLFDNDFSWGNADVNSSFMDLQNVATHEIGHGAGLDDLYEDSCSLETMYGYSTEGETIKRNLNDGDKLGIGKLYGI